MSRVRATDFEERDYYPAPRRSVPEFDERYARQQRTVTRSPPRRQYEERAPPSWLHDDGRRNDTGQMVLRQRDVETYDRRRSPSPPPARVREERMVRRARSATPPRYDEHERERTRIREREREQVRSPSVHPPPVRYVERRRSPSPVERSHIHIVDRERERERERESSPSSSSEASSQPQPKVIKGPTVEREVITHYRDIDHGMVKARPPSPPPATRAPPRERQTDIDISLSRDRTEVDIRRSQSRVRSRSRERRSNYHEEELHRDIDRLKIDDKSRRRARSVGSPQDEEARYITDKIDSRGRMGEAWGGATKEWTIVDVPPGTERVRMDGIGGASADTSWSKYSGVRRTEFIPERDGAPAPRAPSPVRDRERDRDRDRGRPEVVYEREREIDIDRTIDRRMTRSTAPPGPPPKEMWTEITKDLVIKEAIEEMGYEYEETDMFFYVMKYLRYEDVVRLTDLSDEIRRFRKDRLRDMEWERDHERRHRHHHHHALPRRLPGPWDDERITEREVIYDSHGPVREVRGYLR